MVQDVGSVIFEAAKLGKFKKVWFRIFGIFVP